jgi:hypothetical protein
MNSRYKSTEFDKRMDTFFEVLWIDLRENRKIPSDMFILFKVLVWMGKMKDALAVFLDAKSYWIEQRLKHLHSFETNLVFTGDLQQYTTRVSSLVINEILNVFSELNSTCVNDQKEETNLIRKCSLIDVMHSSSSTSSSSDIIPRNQISKIIEWVTAELSNLATIFKRQVCLQHPTYNFKYIHIYTTCLYTNYFNSSNCHQTNL